MQQLRFPAGSRDVSVVLRIIDAVDGSPETAVVYNTSGIDLQYRREGAAAVAITEADLAALTTAHADGGFKHIGQGYYRLDLPDAAVAKGSTGVMVFGTVTGMVVIGAYVHLDPFPGVIRGDVDDTGFTPTTTAFETDITEATADHFNGRRVVFLTGALKDQATDITDYALVSGRGRFTVTALTEAPADGDQFLIL